MKELQKIVALEVIDPSPFSERAFNVENNMAIDINFDAVGYQSSNVIVNLGIPFYFLLAIPVVILALYLITLGGDKLCRPEQKCARFQPVHMFAEAALKGIFFNGIIITVDIMFCFSAACCLIQTYQVGEGEYPKGASNVLAWAFAFLCIPYTLTLLFCLSRKLPKERRIAL